MSDTENKSNDYWALVGKILAPIAMAATLIWIGVQAYDKFSQKEVRISASGEAATYILSPSYHEAKEELETVIEKHNIEAALPDWLTDKEDRAEIANSISRYLYFNSDAIRDEITDNRLLHGHDRFDA